MTADIDPDEEWINAEVGAEDATPDAARALLESVEHGLRGAPNDGRRYDVTIEVTGTAGRCTTNEHTRRLQRPPPVSPVR